MALMDANEECIGSFERINYIERQDGSSIFRERIGRVFRNKSYIYSGKIHEQLCGGTGRIIDLPMSILHDGYSGNDEYVIGKAKRNEKLLLEEIKEKKIHICYISWERVTLWPESMKMRLSTLPNALNLIWMRDLHMLLTVWKHMAMR